MKVLEEGVNPLFMDPDPDKAREFFRDKSRAMVDKRMTEKEAVERFVRCGYPTRSFTRSCGNARRTWAF
jgi:hypothetical protein